MNTLKKEHRHFLDKRLLFRLRMYFVISLILLLIVLFEMIAGKVSLFLVLVSFVIGGIVGLIGARMFLLSWDNDAKKVISQLDVAGGVILVLYILFEVFRNAIVGHFVQSDRVTGVSLALVLGVMVGRVFGTGQKIIRILKEQDLFEI